MLDQLRAVFQRKRPLAVWHHEFYRFPIASAESTVGLETRRADDALYFLMRQKAVLEAELHTPHPVSFEALLRVHTPAYVESLTQSQTLASIFAIDVAEIEAETLLASIRVACGGTVEAAQYTVATKEPALNLLGGFHHAGPGRGGGFCAANDIAVAVAALRAGGFTGKVAVIDLDAHPSDGTAECFRGDPTVWLASISGVSWGAVPGVDEVVLPAGSGDQNYLAALDALLGRMPGDVALAFVLAGGDVIGGDRLGLLGVTLAGARTRDLTVAEKLEGLPQVWLPAGGYGPHAWKVLAGTALALAFKSDLAIPDGYDPLAARFSRVSKGLSPDALGSEPLITESDLAEVFGHRPQTRKKLLGFYTAEGLEYALEAYGLLPLIRRLGYGELRAELDNVGTERARLTGTDSKSHERVVLIELEVERRAIGGGSFLFINWLSLRNPRARFNAQRPQLPGQEVPGLGLAREMSQMLALMAKRLVLDGVAFRPSWYHMAFAARHTARFVAADRQGRFLALVDALKGLSLLEATHAVAEGKVTLDGRHYTWEPDEMVTWLAPGHADRDAAEIEAERARCRFAV